MRKIAIIFGILSIIGIILIIPVETTEPYIVMGKQSIALISDHTYTVQGGTYEDIPVYIDTSDKSNILVSGSIDETTGGNIDFYIKDRLLNKYEYGPVKVTTYRSFDFVPENSGYYDFYLKNPNSIFAAIVGSVTTKLPEISATMSWESPVTKYREISKPIYQSL